MASDEVVTSVGNNLLEEKPPTLRAGGKLSYQGASTISFSDRSTLGSG